MNNRLVAIAGAALSLALAASVQAHATVTFSSNDLVADGFESPSVASAPNGFTYNGNDYAGALFDDDTGLAANNSAFGYAAAPEGVQIAHIQGTGVITYDVSGLVGGQTYNVSLYAAQRGQGYNVDPVAVSYTPQLGVDPTVLTITPTSTAFTKYSQNFTYYGGTNATFMISGQIAQTSTPYSGDYNAGIDVFQLAPTSAVPEPATWALMIVGIGGIGLAFRQPKRRHGFGCKNALAA